MPAEDTGATPCSWERDLETARRRDAAWRRERSRPVQERLDTAYRLRARGESMVRWALYFLPRVLVVELFLGLFPGALFWNVGASLPPLLGITTALFAGLIVLGAAFQLARNTEIALLLTWARRREIQVTAPASPSSRATEGSR